MHHSCRSTVLNMLHSRHDHSAGHVADLTLDTSLNSKMPFGEEESKARRVFLFMTNSAMNLSRAVVTSGVSAQASRHSRTTGKCAGYSQSNSRPASHTHTQ